MMNNNKPFLFIIFFAFTLTATTMNAQERPPADLKLDIQQRSIVIVAALTATGDMAALKTQFNMALDAGLTVNEIKEILVQLYAYCGFPRSLNAISTFMSVLEDRKSNGIMDKQGKEAVLSKLTPNKYEQGRKVLEMLTNIPQQKPAPGFGEFAPRIDAFLKEHLFADIFESDVLSYQQRELVTIAALAVMPGVESQLQSHIKMGVNTGISAYELGEVAALIGHYSNRTQANVLRKLIAKPIVPIVEPDMMVRISEIEIVPEYLEEYRSILKEEAAASVKIEPGVIAIFPMHQQDDSTQIRIIEIYANKAAYQAHLQTPHFQHYKTSTLKMVKSLKLVDMASIDQATIPAIFKKLQ